ncbi:MAG: GNAT family N-acetyltransferase [Bacteroidota bacterium]
MIILETNRLALRCLTVNDVKPLEKVLSDPETMEFYPAIYQADEIKLWIEKSIKSYERNNYGLWGIVHKEDDRLIGQCGISDQEIDGEIVQEIGYQLHKDYWNQGIATEAAGACLQYGFDRLGLDELYIHTYIKNAPSQRVAEKIGMDKLKVYDKHLKTYDLIWPHVVYVKHASA